MQRIRTFFSHFHLREILKALVFTIGFSFLYNVPYIFTFFLNTDARLAYLIQIVLSLLSAIGLYFICTKVWSPKSEKLDLGAILRILILQGIYILLVSALIVPLASLAIQNGMNWLMIIVQLFSTLCLIFMVPFQLLYYYALFLGKRSWREIFAYIKGVFKKNYKPILNVYCGLILFIMAMDTISGGTFSLASGFNVPVILHSLLYMGNPMMSWMMALFVGLFAGISIGQMFAILFFLFILGCLYAYLELNFVLFMQDECIDYGNQRTKTHR